MTTDILEKMGYLALGSRLKRLAETLQTGAARVLADAGLPIQPGQVPLLAALEATEFLTVSEAVQALGVSQPAVTRTINSLVSAGLIEAQPDENDSRIKRLSLTKDGRDLVDTLNAKHWPHIEAAARDLASGPPDDFLKQVARIETRLAAAPLDVLVRRHGIANASKTLKIRDFDPSLAGAFADITREWVSSMFSLEENDLKIIANPQNLIIDRGGVILFVEAEDLGIVGTCALMPIEGGSYELTKMGVLETARGRRAGDFLMEQVLQRAREMGMAELFLLTNRKCAAAIRLYEKSGFVHDPDIMARFGGRYQRCDVAMSYDLKA